MVIPEPAPRPEPVKGEDARVYARRALSYGDTNATRLEQAKDAYGDVADKYVNPLE